MAAGRVVGLMANRSCAARTTLRQRQCFLSSYTPVRQLYQTTQQWSGIKSGQLSAPAFGFVFDIDGVLLRSDEAIGGAREAVTLLQDQQIPFMLLTNGGGKTETARVADINGKLDLKEPIQIDQFIQSHTPFQDLVGKYMDKTVLVVGGDKDNCRTVAESYGFRNVVVPGDLLIRDPDLWPFSRHLLSHYEQFTCNSHALATPTKHDTPPLDFGAIFVFNDPRDWGLDATVMADAMLADVHLNTDPAKRPYIYWSNPDVLWAARHPIPRIGQGGFRAAFWGLLDAMSAAYGTPPLARDHYETLYGKPNLVTMQYCETRLLSLHRTIHSSHTSNLKRVYMVGDNPASDIEGANKQNKATVDLSWAGILVETGVYAGEILPEQKKPAKVAANVLDAVKWAIAQERKA